MASSKFSDSVLKAKFRGCMIGALVGDCLGAPFEVEANFLVSQRILREFMNNILDKDYVKTLPHTDDTRMTIGIASSIAALSDVDAKDVAKRFVEEYYRQPYRGYGTHVTVVFHKLKKSNYRDVYLPAKQQFNGSGSFGNGGAMRTAPIALFGNSKGEEYIVNAAKECALITHAHRDGYNGTILQCLAVNAALELDPSQELDPIGFIDSLLEKMETIENTRIKPYCESLNTMKEIFMKNQDNITSEDIAESLGNGHDVSALKSVPTAIYSFLRGMKPFKTVFDQTELQMFMNSNPFLRTLFFAISVGGDTDTIGTMAGSIAGAYYGEEMIPDVIQRRCESIDEIISLADKLFDATYKKE